MYREMQKFRQRIAIWFDGLVLGVVASMLSAQAVAATPDPWEPMNRGIYRFNDWADRRVLEPTAQAYVDFVPAPVRRGVNNVFDNVGTPAVALNQLLQGKPVRAASDTGRFLLNSTLGLAGIFDVASRIGLDEHQEDFGQTLGVWGFDSGNYMVIPLLGSSSIRHSVGQLLDAAINPLRFIEPTATRNAVVALSVIDLRAGLLGVDDLVVGERYLFMKDSYVQRREFLISDGQLDDDPFEGDEFDDGQDF